MTKFPLYSDSQKKIHSFLVLGGIVGIVMTAIGISLYQGQGANQGNGPLGLSQEMVQSLISFVFLFLGFYVSSSYFFFQFLIIDREKKEFYIGRKIFRKIIRAKIFKIKDVKEVK